MNWKDINLPGYEGLYRISEYGDIYSTRKQKLLSLYAHDGYYSYKKVTITPHEGKPTTKSVHNLVATHFNGPKPGDKHRTLWKDSDTHNNHFTNLGWITHSQNILRAGNYKSEHSKPNPSLRKMKKILAISDDKEIIFDSIEEFCEYFKTYRKKFNRTVNSHKTINGFKIRYL